MQSECKQWEYLAAAYLVPLPQQREGSPRNQQQSEAAITEWLNQFGKDGWELVGFTDKSMNINCIFKRER